MRDLNEDVRKQPFNDEMKEIAYTFGALMRPIIETIDHFGLKRHHLRKHKAAIARFYDHLSRRQFQTEVAIGYRKRFEKQRERLFTFLDHDGVPWNNNNAEHAIKAFARLRNVIGSNSTPKGIREYLILLSINETCKYKGLNFLSFLRSGETDISAFCELTSRARISRMRRRARISARLRLLSAIGAWPAPRLRGTLRPHLWRNDAVPGCRHRPRA